MVLYENVKAKRWGNSRGLLISIITGAVAGQLYEAFVTHPEVHRTLANVQDPLRFNLAIHNLVEGRTREAKWRDLSGQDIEPTIGRPRLANGSMIKGPSDSVSLSYNSFLAEWRFRCVRVGPSS